MLRRDPDGFFEARAKSQPARFFANPGSLQRRERLRPRTSDEREDALLAEPGNRALQSVQTGDVDGRYGLETEDERLHARADRLERVHGGVHRAEEERTVHFVE